ncbi:glycosyltransferase family 4 protein [Ornithinimicrobium pekingense]|uniref:Phosphatidyl-myo-inositol mannosyltransferase n=1 Tax=Ornithinimicrobium pekingense TaxID=384677 RepID=A0ABQ2FA69_9MICO|nr:glycosyltransferase family 4 protein [Ornithinimicrobium pekingense]GGK76410.1 phosphatidyl-myo-inositol mannosyltransferase [Ornithinimicrobium pekingense]
MRIGLVCPYDLSRPGGVQAQVLGLAEGLLERGYDVSVLGPGQLPGPAPGHVVSAGPSRAVRANGSVAHLAVGPSVPRRVERWLERARPDVVHVHEPATPGLAVTAVRRARAAGLPVVATFHASRPVGRAARAGGPLVRRVLGPLAVTSAVSRQAWRVAHEQYHLDPVIVPNALDVGSYRRPDPLQAQGGDPHDAPQGDRRPTVLFLGRRDEPRKGLPVLVEALPELRALVPGLRVVLAGPGRVTVAGADDVGEVDESGKRALLHTSDVLVAPHTGRESFGIVLAEAMAAGTPVVASDLLAFRDVLGDAGLLVPPRDASALARAVASVLTDPALAADLRRRGARRVQRFDWPVVVDRWEELYDGSVSGARRAGS